MSIFNILLTIHILFGTICLITGIAAMVAQRRKENIRNGVKYIMHPMWSSPLLQLYYPL